MVSLRAFLRPALLVCLVLAAGGDLAPAGNPRPTVRPVAPPLPEVTISAVGDITMGSTPALPPEGGAALFADVAPLLRGDVVLGNLETALTDEGVSKCAASSSECFAFRAPPAYAARLKEAGFTILNTANNHSFDFGETGLDETIEALESNGLRHTGRPSEIATIRAGSARVAVLGFAPHLGAQDLLDLAAVRRLVRRADRAADLVVVTMHAGGEGLDRAHVRPGGETYLGESRGNVVAFAHTAVEAGADLVAGHGPHVLRGLEWYRGRLIAYSLGNFSGHGTFNLTGDLSVSAVLRVVLRTDGSLVRGALLPVRLVGHGTPVPDRAESAVPLVRSLSEADFGPRAAAMSPKGGIVPPGRRYASPTRSAGSISAAVPTIRVKRGTTGRMLSRAQNAMSSSSPGGP
jgi:poly-gamma-glutamate capsule biosynthesis protein CapA/YwtB (metallophosphatase superfamily)